MKKLWLSSAALGTMAAPVGADASQTPLTIGVVMTDAATARVTIDGASFLLPDEQAAMRAALDAMPDKARPVVLSVTGRIEAPYRVIGGLIYLAQSTGFTEVSVVTEPAASAPRTAPAVRRPVPPAATSSPRRDR